MTVSVVLVNTNLVHPPIAPLGLDYVGESLRTEGIEVDVLDLCFADEPQQAIRDYFGRHNPRLVGITIRNTDDCLMASGHSFLPTIRDMVHCLGEVTDAPLVLGGCGFSVMPGPILAYMEVDLGMTGDTEVVFPRLVRTLAGGGDPNRVPGVVRPLGEASLSLGPAYSDLARLPQQSRTLVDNVRYFRQGGMAGVETKRGCGKACSYCADPLIKGQHVRCRPPADVAGEIASLVRQGIDNVHVCDSEFNLPPQHAEALCREFICRRLHTRVRWYAYCSPQPMSRELIELMKRAGCAGINFGVDSANDAMLARLGRDFTVADLRRTADACHSAGLVFMYDLLLGGPAETPETVRRTLARVKEMAPDRVGISSGVRVYPNTPLARWLKAAGPLATNSCLWGPGRNDDLLSPVFYVSDAVGRDLLLRIEDAVGDDERFLFPRDTGPGKNYNYNGNQVLVEAIRHGYRGAYWDILRRLSAN